MSMRRNVRLGGGIMVEALESRMHLSTTIAQTGSTLAIYGNVTPHTLKIDDSFAGTDHQTRISIDSDGDGQFTGPQDINGEVFNNIASFDIRLQGADQKVLITSSDGYDGANKTFSIKTGRGNDTVAFSHALGNNIHNSHIAFNITTGNGNDLVDLSLQQISASSTFTANVTMGDGNDTLDVSGGNRVAFSNVAIISHMGSGHNTVRNLIDWDGFDLLGASSSWRLLAYGGAGDDVMQVTGVAGNSAAKVQGLLQFCLWGQGGNDNISVDLGQFDLQGGTFKVREVGSGAGNDNISLSADIRSTTHSGMVDAGLRGGDGNDVLNLAANVDPTLSYAAPAGILLDGGLGANTATVSGNARNTKQNI